jgi:hypothetical protein
MKRRQVMIGEYQGSLPEVGTIGGPWLPEGNKDRYS